MKNHDAGADARLTLTTGNASTTVDLYSPEGLDLVSNLWVKLAAQHRLMYEVSWLGRPIIQLPTDIVLIQELIWTLRPDVIVETGVAHGGSLVLSASILELIGKGKVIGVDIEIRSHNRAAIEAHPLAKRIHLVEGSSTADATLEQVRQHCAGAGTVLVFLDSNHTHAHVAEEMRLYHPLVTPGSYLVVHDGAQAWVSDIPRGKPEWRHDHPLTAIHEFVAAHPDFRIDPRLNRLLITSSPDGFLRRLTQEEMSAA